MRIRTISKKFGFVIFEVVHNRARQIDSTGSFLGPPTTYDASVKWILDQLEYMRKESPDLSFEPF